MDGTEPFYGLTVRASETDALGWKRFKSNDYSDGNLRPFLELTYVNKVGASDFSPAMNSTVATLTPTLWVSPSTTASTQVNFRVCNGDDTAHLVRCNDSGWQPSGVYVVPAGWLDGWSKRVWWAVQFYDGYVASPWQGWFSFMPVVAQPPITSHLAGAPEGAEIPGVNPRVGNFATTVTDAQVSVAGPALSLTRTYNSQDTRTSGAFGQSWSTPWDQRAEQDSDGTGNVVVTLASGRQVRFGRNADSSYSPAPGENLDLVFDSANLIWTLRDPSGYRGVFAYPSGQLVSVTDPDGRSQTYAYSGTSGNLALNKPTTFSAACNDNEIGAHAVTDAGRLGEGNGSKPPSGPPVRWAEHSGKHRSPFVRHKQKPNECYRKRNQAPNCER